MTIRQRKINLDWKSFRFRIIRIELNFECEIRCLPSTIVKAGELYELFKLIVVAFHLKVEHLMTNLSKILLAFILALICELSTLAQSLYLSQKRQPKSFLHRTEVGNVLSEILST